MGYYPQNDPAGLYPPSPSGHHYANGAGTSSPAPGSLYNYGYGQHALPYGGSPLATPTAPGSSVEDFSYRNEADTWGVPQSSSSGSLARERYLARKEAQAAAASEKAGLFGGGAKEGDDYGDHSYSYGALGGKRGGGSRRKWWLIGGGVVLLAIVGVVIGIVVSRKISNSASSNAGVEGVVKQAGSDPSNFEKDSRLHNSFFGMCYTPLNSQYPACGDTLDAVIEDVQLLSQLTTRLRLYGADCNVTALTLEAIQRTKTNLTIFPAIWINGDDTIYSRGADAIISALQTYGTDHVAGISVGNEYMLNGGNLTYLGAKIADMRSRIAALGLGKPIPVGTADAGSKITEALAATCDYVMSNVHPWFGGVPVDQAAGWTWDYFNTNTPAVALSTPNKPAVYIAETGWPTGANATAFETFQGAIAGVDELNTFLSTFVCQANANGTTADTFWFEAFDEPWKDPLYGGVEAHWGLFNSNKTLKSGVVIPNCAHS
ncbi:glycoside hydrolase family 17 protein [Tilletiaria anomala UBC 951]|uniref:glucan endo-1,3-beta-D-glucosidase n=1 Tax=Tilletiaria anomala (strain ATCC 24038 / CBS 436.72 / UBC 951) TaxID=1037660 RepID=A0A066WR47_TILAU|nr:glycoside hydrolase family 17 protein [Tilletiaria anomala UBC 951]KDN53120.1 glycoside hydrolase family 17 protein [Tilletiaria anomala UBC 951]